MRSSLASCTPVKGMLSKALPGVKYWPAVNLASSESTSVSA
jgi:hypothetical protein